MTDTAARIFPVDLHAFSQSLLEYHHVRTDVAYAVAAGLVQTSTRGVDSHGIRLLPHYVRALKAGRLNPDPHYRFTQSAAATGVLDADHTFGHAAGSEGMRHTIELAGNAGIGMVTVANSSHFGAAAFFALQAAAQNLIGLAFTHADSLMLSYAGQRAFFGTNPICIAAPCAGEEPFCLDMATSRVNWNKILQYRETGEPLPSGWAVDSQGQETHSANAAATLQPIGDYKGFGLAMMVEILCSLLTGMPFGRQISSMYKAPIEEKRLLGHCFIAIRIDCFQPLADFKTRLQQMMADMRREPAANVSTPVRVPNDPEKEASALRSAQGIPINAALWCQFEQWAGEFSIPLRRTNG